MTPHPALGSSTRIVAEMVTPEAAHQGGLRLAASQQPQGEAAAEAEGVGQGDPRRPHAPAPVQRLQQIKKKKKTN